MADQQRNKSNSYFAKQNHIALKKSEVTKPQILSAAVTRASVLGKTISSNVDGGWRGGGASAPASTVFALDFREPAPVDQVTRVPPTFEGAPTLNATDGLVLNGTDQAARICAFEDLMLPAGDFTIELFGLKFGAVSDGSVFGNDNTSAGSDRGPHIYFRTSTNRFIVIFSTSGDGALQTSFNYTPTVGQKIHLCLERSGDTLRLYVDGTALGQQALSGSNAYDEINQTVNIGRRNKSTGDFANISVESVRVCGEALYAGDFTPPKYIAANRSGLDYGRKLAAGVRTWFNFPSMFGIGGNKVLFGVACDPKSITSGGSDGPASFLWEWDVSTGVSRMVQQGGASQQDDHNEGGVLKLESGDFLWLPMGHNVGDALLYRGSSVDSLSEANIDSALGSLNYSYANLLQLEGATDDPVYLFGRANDPWQQLYSSSTDDGATWGTYTAWLGDGTTRPYLRYAKNGTTRIDFAMTDGHPNEGTNKVYHGYFENGSFYTSDGTEIVKALPLLPSDFTEVHDGTNNGWVWDIAVIGGDVHILYSTFPTTSAHRYHRAVYSGSSWSTEIIVNDAGGKLYAVEAYYSGGMVHHPTNANVVFACIEDGSEVYQLNRMDKSTGSWVTTQLTSGAGRSFRPSVSTNPLALTWVYEELNGTGYGYENYTDYAGCCIYGAAID